jgi:hypothetical protein
VAALPSPVAPEDPRRPHSQDNDLGKEDGGKFDKQQQ